MADCCKRVVYLSCLELGSKVKRAGFIKAECREGRWVFDMHISGMTECPERKYEIYAVDKSGEEYGIGSVFLHRGNGEWKWGGKSGELGNGRISCDGIVRFIVKISEDKIIEGTLQGIETDGGEKTAGTGSDRRADARESRWRKTGRPEFMAAEKWKGEERLSKPTGVSALEGEREETKGLLGKRISLTERRGQGQSGENNGGKRERNGVMPERRGQEEGKGSERREKGIRMEELILNDKWEQLRKMYPVVHPYEDEREYISIQPKDFVIMTGDYQHLANNSFLLHGFYNYRHIVLGREPGEGEAADAAESDRNRNGEKGQRNKMERGNHGIGGTGNEDARGDFYLGVPGVYYEREKMVALMFGFEAFECCGGKAESGKFGYYLRKVKI